MQEEWTLLLIPNQKLAPQSHSCSERLVRVFPFPPTPTLVVPVSLHELIPQLGKAPGGPKVGMENSVNRGSHSPPPSQWPIPTQSL